MVRPTGDPRRASRHVDVAVAIWHDGAAGASQNRIRAAVVARIPARRNACRPAGTVSKVPAVVAAAKRAPDAVVVTVAVTRALAQRKTPRGAARVVVAIALPACLWRLGQRRGWKWW